MRAKPIVVGALLAIAVVAWFALDLGRFLTLEKLHEHQQWLVQQKDASPLLFGAAFFAVYILITGASIPGATVLTLAAGAVFGLLWGVVLVSFASALGATIAFIVARYLLRDFVRRRFEKQSAAVDTGIKKDGIFYLLALRRCPAGLLGDLPWSSVNTLQATLNRFRVSGLRTWLLDPWFDVDRVEDLERLRTLIAQRMVIAPRTERVLAGLPR